LSTLLEIRQSVKFVRSGTLSQMMDHLIVAGFVVKTIFVVIQNSNPIKTEPL
jgi:uncharacterized protein